MSRLRCVRFLRRLGISGLGLNSPKPRRGRAHWRPDYAPAIESLEDRSLLSGDTIATAAFVDLQDGQADHLSAEIGDEPLGNLDVDLYRVSLTAGQQLVISATSVTPVENVQRIATSVQAAINANPDSADKLHDVAEHLADALAGLGDDPDAEKALGALEKAVKDLDDAAEDGEVSTTVATDLMNRSAGAARSMALNLVNYGNEVNQGHKSIAKAQKKLAKGDNDRADSEYAKAIGHYEDAVSDANKAADDVCVEDQSQALKTVIVAIRLFNSSGVQVAAASGTGTVKLVHSTSNAGTFYVGISGNHNFLYDPYAEASGEEGSTGSYVMDIVANNPPIITSFAVANASYLGVGWYELTGSVEDELPEACVVYFGGIAEDESAGVLDTGLFSSFVFFGTTEGVVTALAVDEFGLFSQVAEDTVDQPA